MTLPGVDMNDCSKKCRCPAGGANAGKLYNCLAPCGPDGGFDVTTCECYTPCVGNIGAQSGGAGTTVDTYFVGGNGGTIVFSWEAYVVKDSFTVSGAANYSTGVVSGNGSVALPLTPGVTTITVTVVGPSGTGWQYGLVCPG